MVITYAMIACGPGGAKGPNLALLALLTGGSNYGSNGIEDTTNWDKRFNNGATDIPSMVRFDGSGNVYVVGQGSNLISGTSNLDWWIKKFNANGVEDTTNWDKKFNGVNATGSDQARAVAIDSSGNVYVVGNGRELVTAGTSASDWWIKKFNSNGTEDLTWDKKFNGVSPNGADDLFAVVVDSTGSVYVGGSGQNLVSVASVDIWIKKFNSNGVEDLTWDKKFDGNTAADALFSLALDSSGNVYAVGSGTNLVGTTGLDWWIKKFSSAGVEDLSWNKKITSAGNVSDEAKYVALDSTGNVFVVGYGTNLVSGTSSFDWWIKKFNSSGIEDMSWDKKIDGNGSLDQAFSCIVDNLGQLYVTGFGSNIAGSATGTDIWIKKYSATGMEDVTNWDKKISSSGAVSDAAITVVVDASGKVFVGGFGTNLVSGTSGADWWIKKFN